MILTDKPFKTCREALACYESIQAALSLCGEPGDVEVARIEFKQQLEALKKHDDLRAHLGVQPISELAEDLFNQRIEALKEKAHDTY
jgi:hypothetical protein